MKQPINIAHQKNAFLALVLAHYDANDIAIEQVSRALDTGLSHGRLAIDVHACYGISQALNGENCDDMYTPIEPRKTAISDDAENPCIDDYDALCAIDDCLQRVHHLGGAISNHMRQHRDTIIDRMTDALTTDNATFSARDTVCQDAVNAYDGIAGDGVRDYGITTKITPEFAERYVRQGESHFQEVCRIAFYHGEQIAKAYNTQAFIAAALPLYQDLDAPACVSNGNALIAKMGTNPIVSLLLTFYPPRFYSQSEYNDIRADIIKSTAAYDAMSDEEKQARQAEVEADIDIDAIDREIDIEDAHLYDVLCRITALAPLPGEQANNAFFTELTRTTSVQDKINESSEDAA